MIAQRKSVEIYLRVRGPLNPLIKPDFKLLKGDTQIRFKQQNQSEEEQIANQFAGQGVFKFQKIFRENCPQEDVYKRVAQDLVQSAIEGYNGTIFAYGQTGSGKTYTMTGGDDDPSQIGIIPRLISDLYKQIQIRQEQITIKLKYMQIYKKNGYDLLHPDNKSKKLEQLPQVKHRCKGDNFQFQNLSQHEVPTFQQAMKIYEYGDTNRIVCKTQSNDQSSRSHCILTISIRTKNRDTGLQQKATINLVDLAGSERIHYAEMDEKQSKEGISINLGLHYLGRVVLSLGEQSRGIDVHVPYRDSLLTMALKSSMGGNCKTRMIATINPNPNVTPESIATCKFSQNLLAMENKLKKNQFINPWDIIKGLKNQVEQLKGQIKRLKGENVKQILEREDYIKIRKMVDQFIQTQSSVTILPINDRLYIREYLNYMKHLLRGALKNKNPPSSQNPQAFQNAISQSYILQIKDLKNQVQQKQHEIQLLLTIINDNKQREKSQGSYQEGAIPIQEPSQEKIVESILKTLQKDKRKKISTISAEDVQKNLIKAVDLGEDETVQEKFRKFKDAHIMNQDIDQKQHQINVKNMKKDVVMKKIKNLKLQRGKLAQQLHQLTSSNINGSFPALNSSNMVKNSQREQQLKQQISQIDQKIKKKYKQLKSIELEVDRLGLCKNKNKEKIKNQFESYIEDKKNKRKMSQYQEKRQNDELEELANRFESKQNSQQTSSYRQSQIEQNARKAVQLQKQKQRQKKERQQQQQKQKYKQNEGQINKHLKQFYQARKQLLSRGK